MSEQRGSQSRSVAQRTLGTVARQISPGIVAAVDIWVGLAWLLLPSSYWASPFYSPAHHAVGFLPYEWQFRAWGVVIIVLALGWHFRRAGHERIARFCITGLCMLWGFWTIMALIGWLVGHVGGLLPPLTFLAARAHWPGTVRMGQPRAPTR